MTRRNLAAILISLLVTITVADARRIRWKSEIKPPVSLEEALKLAKAKLRASGEFYCVGAQLAETYTHGDWRLEMACGNKFKFVSVGSDSSVIVGDILIND